MIGAPGVGPAPGTSLNLAGSSAAAPSSDLKAAARQFEAIFVRQMLAAARASDFGGEPLFGGPGLKQFNAMRDDHIAQAASETGAFGFAQLIEAQLAQQTEPQTQANGS